MSDGQGPGVPWGANERPDIKDIAEEAELAFWAVVAKRFPSATSGDFPPEADMAFTQAARKAVVTWVRWNVPGKND